MRRVVLVRPSGPRNAGMIVRAAVNFGPCELVFVAPQLPSLLVHPEFEQMSHGVPDARERCRVVATVAEALAGTTHSVGFTARPQEGREREGWRERREALATLAADPEECVAFVFGAEAGGLRSEEIAACSELCAIATSGEHTSLNLAIAVGIVLAELFHERPHVPRERGVKALSHEGRAFLKANLAHVFGDKVARTDAARRDILASIERVFSRAPLEDRDARAWHLMLRALGSTLTPVEAGVTLHTSRARHKHLQAASLAKPRVLFVSRDERAADRARSLAAQLGFAVESAPELASARTEFEPDLVVALDAAADVAELARAFPDARCTAIAPAVDQSALASLLDAELARRTST